MANRTARTSAYEMLEPHPHGEPGLSPANKLLVIFIVLASAFAILETEPTLYAGRATLFRSAELLFGAIFSVEYVLRLWIAPPNDRPLPASYAEIYGGSVDIGGRGGIHVADTKECIVLEAE